MKTAHEWLNTNSLRSYPLTERSKKTSVGNYVEIPDDLIVDLELCVPETVTYPCRISTLSFTGRLLSILIQDAADLTMGIATVDLDTWEEYASYPMQTGLAVEGGVVTLGKGVETLLSSWPRGNHYFKDAFLEPTTCPPVELGPVLSLGVHGLPDVLIHDVKLFAGDNVKLEYDFEDNAIVFTTIQEGYLVPECEPNCDPDQCNRVPIRTINDIPPTAAGGQFFFDGDPIVVVSQRECTIVFGSTLLPADLCPNYTQGPDGRPGGPGAPGGGGGGGGLICQPGACQCIPCDPEDPSLMTPVLAYVP